MGVVRGVSARVPNPDVALQRRHWETAPWLGGNEGEALERTDRSSTCESPCGRRSGGRQCTLLGRLLWGVALAVAFEVPPLAVTHSAPLGGRLEGSPLRCIIGLRIYVSPMGLARRGCPRRVVVGVAVLVILCGVVYGSCRWESPLGRLG